ncbi:MAG TPA: 2OG-Fe(II) oxygenase [Pyrinomonadaceae bacterium]|nr:2OG-Fe(II) oxygenase [Pyrinomonadaceae bacterium]
MNTSIATQLGIYTEEDFLDREACEGLKASVRAGSRERAKVYEGGSDYVLNESRRSAVKVSVSSSAASAVRERLLAKCEEFSRRFGVEVKDCQEPTFLVYKPGDFFEPHRDYTESQNAPGHVRRRRVSAVVFLGDESAGGVVGDYEGGSLAFYGLLKDPRCRHVGIPVTGKAGTLVAFRSDVFHEVSPVTKGERLTIVSWFF